MVDVTEATFQTEVMDRSEEVPVVVDLWAEWCGPCKTLGPIIEQVIDETNGEVVLAKVDVDANPALAQAFQVQGIPAVHALRNGTVVASFQGAQPEAAVRQFVDGLRPSAADREIAGLLEAGDEASLRKVIELVPDHAAAIVALAELEVGAGRTDEALALLAKVPESAETRRVAALARTGAPAETVAAADGPLADVEAKLDDLLTRVKTDEDARQEFVDLLELMGPGDPRTAGYRRALSRQLF